RTNATGLTSHARPLLFIRLAWKGVVPRPQNGSHTRSPGTLKRSIQCSANDSGNMAKYGDIAWKRCLGEWWVKATLLTGLLPNSTQIRPFRVPPPGSDKTPRFGCDQTVFRHIG